MLPYGASYILRLLNSNFQSVLTKNPSSLKAIRATTDVSITNYVYIHDEGNRLSPLYMCVIVLSVIMILRRWGRLGFSSRIQLGKDIKSIKDNYNAVHITPLTSICNSSFQEYMSGLLKQSNSNETSSIWVHLAKDNLSLIDELVCRQGFKMHHSKG